MIIEITVPMFNNKLSTSQESNDEIIILHYFPPSKTILEQKTFNSQILRLRHLKVAIFYPNKFFIDNGSLANSSQKWLIL